MDHIEVRQLRFDFQNLNHSDLLWSRSHPDFAMFINALGVHVPYFERFLVKVLRKVRPAIVDPRLLADVQGLIGQEAHHAVNFIAWNQALATRYPRVQALEAHAQEYFERVFERRSTFFQVGFMAGYETFTFLGGLIILDRYREFMADAHPGPRALWVWHQVEEVEHGAVAFDVYKALYGEREWARKGLVVVAFGHIAWETLKACAHMSRVDGYFNRPLRALKAWAFFARFTWDLARTAVPVLRRDYHPRNHPICNDDQNVVAMAWREYYDSGADPHRLTDGAVSQMIAAFEGGA